MIKEPLHPLSRRMHLRSRAVCGVANPRNNNGYCCGLRLAAHPDPQRLLSTKVMQRFPKRTLRYRRLKRLWRVVCLCILTLCVAPATPNAQRVGRLASVPTHPSAQAAQSWLHQMTTVTGTWESVQTLSWFEHALWYRRFSLNQPLGLAAQQLTQVAPSLNRVLTGSKALLLSGMLGDAHLVIQLQATTHGVIGFASVLAPSAPQPHFIVDATQKPALAWLPSGTQIHAAQWSMPDGTQASQSIYALTQPLAKLGAQLRPILQRQGWEETVAFTGTQSMHWQRGQDHIHLMSDRHHQGSLFYQLRVQ